MQTRALVRIRGVVQGVGFRPFVYRLARSFALRGSVRNAAGEVAIEVQGPRADLDEFLERLRASAPPVARVDRILVTFVEPIELAEFEVIASERGLSAPAIPPDGTPCKPCLRELRDAADRRFEHAFVSCTDCGPRFTVARGVPFDRASTSYAAFELCSDCRAEYERPKDRRFHAETVACPRCGPVLAFFESGDPDAPAVARGAEALSRARELVRRGGILALKGVGGWQLACDARDERVVAELRRRKRRPSKPLAVMVPSLESAAAIVDLVPGARETLESSEGPIVLLPERAGSGLAPSIAPGLAQLGVLLPSSPLHALLVAEPWVMTSGNVADEPLLVDDGDHARRTLAEVAQGFLAHDREIVARADDSVVQVFRGAPRVLRRARGYVPRTLLLPRAGPDLVAFGGDLKSTICVVKDGRALVSQHLGDLSSPEAERALEEALAHLSSLVGLEARAVACDLHPDYASTRLARARGLPVVAVQHHHAHAAACLAEHGRTGPALVAALDGAGWGTDGTIWGGELLVADLERCDRVGRLRPVPLPGGDAAAREPWRVAVAHLVDAGVEHELARVDEGLVERVRELVQKRVASPLTSSAGRLFDAVAALAGVRVERDYEGQAAIELEAASRGQARDPYAIAVTERDSLVELDTRPLVREVVADVRAGATPSRVSGRFHAGLATALARALALLAERTGIKTIALVGGCFQNRLLLELVAGELEAEGLEVLYAREFPSGDGGLSLGQAAVASAVI
jgi:hydrogenase maturation protein HypF